MFYTIEQKRELFFAIWEIILRALPTRALNLRPIAVHKSSIIYWYGRLVV